MKKLLIAFFLHLHLAANAQHAHPYQGISLNTGFFIAPSRPISDSAETYQLSQFKFGLRVPLYSHINKDTLHNRPSQFILMANNQYTLGFPKITFINTQHTLINASLGLSSFYTNGGKGYWLGGLTAGVLEDNYTLQNASSLHFTGFGIYTRKASNTLRYTIGAAYNFSFGQGIPLPILGLRIRLSEQSNLNILLLSSITYRYNAGKGLAYHIFFKPSGVLNNIANNGDFPGKMDILRLRHREYKLGTGVHYRINTAFRLLAEGGFLLARKLYVSESTPVVQQPENVASYTIRNGLFIELKLTYRLPSKKNKVSTPSETDYELDNIDYDTIENGL